MEESLHKNKDYEDGEVDEKSNRHKSRKETHRDRDSKEYRSRNSKRRSRSHDRSDSSYSRRKSKRKRRSRSRHSSFSSERLRRHRTDRKNKSKSHRNLNQPTAYDEIKKKELSTAKPTIDPVPINSKPVYSTGIKKVNNKTEAVNYDEDEDLFASNKQESNYEQMREQRRKKLESFKQDSVVVDTSKVTTDYKEANSKIISSSQHLSNNLQVDIKFTKEDQERLLHFVEEQRLKNDTLAENIKVEVGTPDIFASTPVDEVNNNKLNLPAFDINENTAGYYVPTMNEVLVNRYKITGVCGKGIFSTVVKVADTANSDKNLACKMIRTIDVMLMSGEKERGILKKLNEKDKNDQSHVVRLLDTFEHKGHICMIFELYDMNLRSLLQDQPGSIGLPLNKVRKYTKQILLAFSLIHDFNIIHADYKPDNTIVTTDRETLKICDFGSALFEEEIVITNELVSRFYRAPEIFLGNRYDMKIDIWSLGCTVFELYTGQIMFPGKNNNEMLKLILTAKGKMPDKLVKRGQFSNLFFDENNSFTSVEIDPVTKKEYIKVIEFTNINSVKKIMSMLKVVDKEITEKELEELASFIDGCLNLDPNKRLSAVEALCHRFVGIKPVF